MDLDGDNLSDVLSGSFPGELYWFRRLPDGTFAVAETLKDAGGKPLNVGSASTAFAADWNADGRLDLLVGNLLGEVFLMLNRGETNRLAWQAAKPLEAEGKPVTVNGDAAPVAADWDGDGRLDLLIGAENGSVAWHRNTAAQGLPKLAAAETLIGESPVGWRDDDRRQPGQWGLRAKICVVDYNGDGRLDILLGDRCGSYTGTRLQTTQEAAEQRQANDELPRLRKKWVAAVAQMRKVAKSPENEAPAAAAQREQQLARARQDVRRANEEIQRVQAIQDRYRPTYQSHGFVWLFLRTAAAE